jgi:hypothetical protein
VEEASAATMPEEQRFLSTLKAAQRSQQKLAAVQAQVGPSRPCADLDAH